jgi:hypothetical protein
MSFADLVKRASKLATDNSPAILTAIGVTGVVTTAYLTGKATFKAAEILNNDVRGELLEPREKVELVWKLYIPAAGTAVTTIACIILADRIGTRRAAAVAAAYTLSEKAFEEYKKKVVEKIGEKKEQEVRDEIAQDRVNERPVSSSQVIITGEGDVLCFDRFTGRYFESSIDKLRKAENETNHQVLNDFYASLSDFYHRVGLPATSMSDDVGWNSDKLLMLDISATLSENDRPCIAVGFSVAPVRGYNRLL